VFVLIERLSGQPLRSADLTVEAVTADPHSAAVLEAPQNAALLMVERLAHLADGRPVDLEFIRFRGDRLTMRGTAWRVPAADGARR
jgi:GntR family transcriptional regulator